MHFNNVILTIDVDWAPDFVIDFIAERIIEKNVKATWFITHASPAIDRLRSYPQLFELGIHPNFKEGSTHGESVAEVMTHCLSILPSAEIMRTHSLVQSAPMIEQIMAISNVWIDLSLFLPYTPYLRPCKYRWHGKTLIRIPYFWQDDYEMISEHNCWSYHEIVDGLEGIKIFNFHPFHIFLNSVTMENYWMMSSRHKDISQIQPDDIRTYIEKSKDGTRKLFMELLQYLARSGSSFVRDIVE